MTSRIGAALVLIIGGGWSLECGGQEVSYTQDSLELIRQRVAANEAVVIDVREQKEWDAGHLKIAALVPTSELADETTRAAALDKIDKNKIVYCHCKMGGRAMLVGRLLCELGYDCRPLDHKYTALVDSGFDEEVPPADPRKRLAP